MIDVKNNYISHKVAQFETILNLESLKIEDTLYDEGKIINYLGFKRMKNRVLATDESIEYFAVFDTKSTLVYGEIPSKLNKHQILKKNVNDLGQIQIAINEKTLFKPLYDTAFSLFVVFLALSILIIIYMLKNNKTSHFELLKPLILAQIIYMLAFVYFGGNVFIKSLSSQNTALVNNIISDINHAHILGIPLEKISGIDTTFIEYINTNKTLSWINIKNESGYIYSIEKPTIETINYTLPLLDKSLSVELLMPFELIYNKILMSIKDFLFILFASNIISYFLFNIFLVINHTNKQSESWKDNLLLIKPLVFFLFFADTLNISILPSYFEDIATTNSLDKTHIKYLFSIYFLSFVLSFFPASKFIKKYGTKMSFTMAFMFLLMGCTLLYVSTNFYIIAIARVFSGIAFGITLITTENHLLLSIPKDKRQLISATTGMLYSAAIISGAVLGSSIYAYFDAKSTFLLEIMLLLCAYMYFVVFIENRHIQNLEKPTMSIKRKIKLLLDWHFIKNVFLAGFFSKVTLSSIIFFTFPLILFQYGYTHAEVGQIIIFYSIGLLLGGTYVSCKKSTTSLHKPIALGLAIGGLSMINIGILDFIDYENIITFSLISSMLILGFSHSLISSYLLPNIFNFKITQEVGIANIRPLVLLLERGGNVFGPLLIGELFLIFGYNLMPILILGILSLICSAIFFFK